MSDLGDVPASEPTPSSPLPPPVGPPVGTGYPGPAYGWPQPYGYPGYPGYPRDHPRAALALGLGIGGIVGGFFTLGLGFALGPFAWYFGQRSRSEIRRGNGAYHSDGNATAGMVLGIIATVFLVLAALAWTLMIIGMSITPSDQNGTNGTNALASPTTLTGRS